MFIGLSVCTCTGQSYCLYMNWFILRTTIWSRDYYYLFLKWGNRCGQCSPRSTVNTHMNVIWTWVWLQDCYPLRWRSSHIGINPNVELEHCFSCWSRDWDAEWIIEVRAWGSNGVACLWNVVCLYNMRALRARWDLGLNHLLKNLFGCPGSLCDPMDCSPPGSSVHGIFLAKVV